MKLGQEIWLKPGVNGYGYFTPDSKGEWFRLRQSIWSFIGWFRLGTITDTNSPDFQDNSGQYFVEYRDNEGNFKYLMRRIGDDDDFYNFLEVFDPEITPGLDAEVTIVKETPITIPWYKKYLLQLLAGALALTGIAFYVKSKKPQQKPTLKK